VSKGESSKAKTRAAAQPDEVADENKLLERQVTVAVTGAVEASSTFILRGPAGTKTKVKFAIGAESPTEIAVLDLTGTIQFGVAAPSLTDQVDKRLGDRKSGETLAATYAQGNGE
jgi:hypothetical protein